MPCVANGLLTDDGIPTICETDIHGAITSIMLQEAAGGESPIFFADLTIRHPENDNAELLWHCGNFPPSLIKEGDKAYIDYNFIMPSHCPGVGVFEIKGGDITVCRFDGDHGEYSMMMGEGRSVDGPKNKGTYVWFEVKDWPMWEKRIVEGPYVHHCAGVHGKVSHILYEACKYLPGLEPDPFEPTKEEIEERLRS
jgi:L-fucose isomerase-like protein